MFQDSITLKNRHLKFIQTVSESGIVYGLKSKNGFATSSSTQFEDEDGNPIGMICFWAEKVRAKSCAKDAWRKYNVTRIPLAEFMENWCVGMAHDGLLIGTQFDQNLFGHEIEPLDLILELTSELKSTGKDLNFRTFNGIGDLEKQVKELKDDFYIDPNLEVETIKTIANSDYTIELKSYDQEKSSSSKLLKDAEGNINGIEIQNSTIPMLYNTLFDVASNKRIIFKDSLSKDDFPSQKEHQYNFMIQASDKYQQKWREVAIEFLNENFDTNAKMGIDSLECYVLKDIDKTIKQSQSESTEFMYMGTILKAKKIKMSGLAEYLENFTPVPVLDKTNLNGEYDILLEWQAEEPKTIHTELKKYGLELVKATGKLPVEIMEIYKKH